MNVRPAALRRRTNNRIPNRYEIDEVASELVVLYGGVIMQDAQRYSLCRADAEDAYQRALEILVTKAPTTDPDHLVPWIRTVVRREAVAIAKSTHNQRSVSIERSAEAVDRAESVDVLPDERIDVIADLDVGNEALKRISKDQVRCLLAQAEGLTYDEIAEATGFSQRKVSRCINDGRQAFLKKVDAIESGSECDRVQPLLLRLVNGDADAAIEARPHLSN
ncbi:MAG: RNA polymerase sigma factor, partial [Solirubrobacterales bacterium]